MTATSGGDVWAVGDYISNQDPSVTLLSLILHWDGTSWKQVDSPSPGPVGLTQLTSVAATSPDQRVGGRVLRQTAPRTRT